MRFLLVWLLVWLGASPSACHACAGQFGIKEGSARNGGGLQWVRDLSGNMLYLSRNGISSVPAASGGGAARHVQFVRDANGRITRIQDERGNSVFYNSEANNDLTSVTDRESNTTRFTYDAQFAHYLRQVLDPRGPSFVPIRNYYTADGRLDYSLDALNNKVAYNHDLSGHEETVLDRLGNQTVMHYDDYGNVSTMQKELKDAGGHFLRWVKSQSEYGDPGNPDLPTKTVDALGHTMLMHYTASGSADEVRMVMDPNDRSQDRVTSTTFDQYQHPLTVKDALGKTVATNSYWTRVDFWAPPGVTNTVRQPEGALRTSTDANGLTTFTGYRANGAPWQVTTAYGTAQAQTTTYSYDFNTGNLTGISDSAGHGTSFSYDGNGNKIAQSTTRTVTNPDGSAGAPQTIRSGTVFDKDDRPIQTLLPGGASSSTHYNPIGKVEYAVDALNRTTSFHYNERGERDATQYPDGTGSSVRYNPDGMAEASFDRSGRGSQTLYDSLGRTVASGPLGTDGQPILHADGTLILSRTVYDDAGRALRSVDELGRASDTRYNAAGEATDSTVYDVDGAGNPVARTTHTDYDADGRGYKVTDALGRFSITRYDDGGRAYQSERYSRTGALLTTEATHYDEAGRADSMLDAAGHLKRMRFDTLGRLSQVILSTQGQPAPDGSGQFDLVTSLGYDEMGHKVWQRDANQHTTRLGYDERGRQVWRALPGGQIESMAYNDGGQLLSTTDFRGYVTTYGYDLRGRMVLKQPDARLRNAGEETLTWGYPDENTRVATRGGLMTTYHSDPQRGWLASVQGPQGTVSYAYDDGGQKRSVSTTQGTSLYDYDAQGRLWHVSDQAGAASPSLLATHGYDAVGNLESVVRGNSVRTRYGFDELNRLTDMVHERATVGGSTTAGAPVELGRFHYTVRDDGKRTGLNESVANNTSATPGALPVTTRGVSYGYDNAGKLTSELGTDGRGVSYRSDWGYDAVGNRTSTLAQYATVTAPNTFSSSTSIGSTFNPNDWLTGQSTSTNGGAPALQSWSYDANGAELTHGYGTSAPQQNGWGFDGRLLGTGTQGAATGGTGYSTDASGNRLSVTLHQGQASQRTTKYLLDENTSYASVLEERAPDANLADGTGPSVLQARYVWGDGLAPLAMWRKGADGQFRLSYFLTDGQESVRQLSDGQGTVTDSYFYDAWGNGLAGGSGSTQNAFRYTGQMLDADGKYFLRARYYDSGTGRFLSHDPIFGVEDDPASLHRYLYAQAEPVDNMDPSGEISRQSEMGYLAEEAIQAHYTADPVYAGDVADGQVLFGEHCNMGPRRTLKPDIFNRNRRQWMDIKPFSVRGVANAVTTWNLYSNYFRSYGYTYDSAFMATPRVFHLTSPVPQHWGIQNNINANVVAFNLVGIVFWKEVPDDDVDEDAITEAQAIGQRTGSLRQACNYLIDAWNMRSSPFEPVAEVIGAGAVGYGTFAFVSHVIGHYVAITTELETLQLEDEMNAAAALGPSSLALAA